MAKNARRLATTLFGLLTAALLAGCATKTTGPVTGKVTVDDKPVRAGQLTFVGGPDGGKHVVVIGYDGRYTVELAPGDYKIGVEGGAMQTTAAKMAHVPAPKAPKDMPAMRDPTGQVKGEGVDVAKEMQNPVIVPMKYRAPESSPFAVTVTGSGATYDIVMKSKG